MGPTPTLGMRLSCNFVNMYTIVYHVRTVHVHVYTRASPTDILARKSARRTKVCGQVGELNGPRTAAARADFHARWTRRLPREDPRTEVGEAVSMSVPWNLAIHHYNNHFRGRVCTIFICMACSQITLANLVKYRTSSNTQLKRVNKKTMMTISCNNFIIWSTVKQCRYNVTRLHEQK